MPFDLFVSRARSFAEMRKAVSEQSGLLRRIFSRASVPIDASEFHELMGNALTTRKSDALYWVRHPENDGGNDPWCTAELEAGYVRFSTSYGHHRFLRNFADMFDLGLRFANALQAQMFDEDGQLVTAASVDDLLEPNSEYVALQLSTWQRTLKTLDAAAQAPLEYPLGPIDLVSDYFLFHVTPKRKIESRDAADAIRAAISTASVDAIDERRLGISGNDGKRLAMALLQKTDARWAVRPAYGQVSFRRLAPATLAALDAIVRATDGSITFNGHEPDAETMTMLRGQLSAGLGLDVHLWLQETP